MNKYRAWDKENKVMRKVSGINFENESVFCKFAELKPFDLGRELSFDDIILMQSTGVKDKNGVEIFEGVVVETIYEEEIFVGVVVYDQSEVGYKVTNGREEYGSNFYYLTGNDSNEVLGNIHANPELLK